MPLYPTIPRTCRQCGKEFLITVSAANAGKGKYCCHACYWKSKSPPAELRFWAKVRKSPGCWEWTAGLVRGYGQIKVDAKDMPAHRYSWQLHFGEIPEGLYVCHRCDNRACVRPDHLFLGTPKDNIHDAMRKGRHATGLASGSYTKPERRRRGEENGFSKLTEAKVRAIRLRWAQGGISYPELAAEYGVSRSHIGYIVRRKNWQHVE